MFVSRIDEKSANEIGFFIEKCSDVYIEQTFFWSSFQKSLTSRKDAGILVVMEEQDNLQTILLSISFSVICTIFNKTYLHVNRGPVISDGLRMSLEKNNRAFALIIEELKKIAQINKSVFIRFDFPFIRNENNCLDYIFVNSRPASNSFQPGTTLFLDLEESEEQILAKMHPKGRYNIKLASKRGVKVRVSDDLIDLKAFYEILRETASRDGFSVHEFTYYEKMFKKLNTANLLKLYIAEYEGKIIAANLVSFFQDKVTYYYGASKSEFRNVMAPYLLQWQAILDAKNAGFKIYDFLGISGKENEKSSWAGITSFKKKFGGFEVNYLPSREIIIDNFFFYLIVILKKIRSVFS